MDKPEEILNEKDIIKRAYKFGFYVGLHGHTDWFGWVAEVKKKIYEEAKHLGVYEEVKKAYIKGKKAGRVEREKRIHLGLMKQTTSEIPEKIKIVSIERNRGSIASLNFPKIEDMPKTIKKPRFFRLPKILRGGEE
ncbi:hypothetical protein PFDSM3638_04365 [Pyrococcus furiosus DSM 3638]|nr:MULTISPECIES: hypothetical protein [Pyrococcus]AFN03662.1 hypothetical protein PFC_03565 [Pyrococcus furiosus COM1]MDK2869796.1 hypothetical protein [Pyrococcus sp.]QEK78545.1 hypothetical protein PFDSM3638_04365 [Pyrococcus furiosus DSM 3638]